MRAQDRGDLSESRAMGALKRLAGRHPEKFRRPRRASPGTDARGIDAFVEINIGTDHPHWMTVPIEIKSSIWGIKKWRVVHSDLYNAGVLNFYIRDRMNDAGLDALFYRALDKISHKSRDGMLYHSMWQRLYGRMSARGRKNARAIKARRDKERRVNVVNKK